mgnify:FL=1
MIRAGAIGNILHVRVQHPEDWVISSAVDGKVDTSAWRFQPEKVGSSLCANDLGTHAEQMVTQVYRPARQARAGDDGHLSA